MAIKQEPVEEAWGWEAETSMQDITQFQHDLFNDVNFDDNLENTSLEHMPFDEPQPTIPSVNVETSSEVGAPIQDAFDFQFDDVSFRDDALNTLASVDQAPAIDFVNPQALFNNPNGPGTIDYPQLNGDFLNVNTNDLTLAQGNLSDQALTVPVPFPLAEPVPQYLESSLSYDLHPAPSDYPFSNSHRIRHSSSASSWQTTPQIQHTLNPRQRRKLASRPPSPRLRPAAVPIHRTEFTHSGRPLDLKSDKIPRHTRQKKEKPDPREWYGPMPPKPPSWGPCNEKDERIFKYTQDGELEAGKFYSYKEIRQYLLGPKPSEGFEAPGLLEGVSYVEDKVRQGLTLWIGLPGSECNWRYPRRGESTKCRFKDCLHDNHTIRQGEYWVIFDERMNKDGAVINPFHNAGYVHLDCFEHYFDLVEIWQHLDVRIDCRNFKYEEYGYFKLGRKYPRIVDELAIWWKDEYSKWIEAKAQGSHRSRVFETSLVSRLVQFDIDNEPVGRQKTRAARNGNDISRHRGNVREQKRWRALKDYGLLDERGEPIPSTNQKLQKYLTVKETEKWEKQQQIEAYKNQYRKTPSAALSTASAPGYPQHPTPSHGANYMNHSTPVPLMPQLAYQTAGAVPFLTMPQSMYQQNMYYPPAAQFSPANFQIQQPFPQPVFVPQVPLTPVPEELPRKRARDATEDAIECSAPKRQRQEPPATPSGIMEPGLVTANEMQNDAADNSEDFMSAFMSVNFAPTSGFEETPLSSALDKELDDFYSDGKSDRQGSNGAEVSGATTIDLPAGLAQGEETKNNGDNVHETTCISSRDEDVAEETIHVSVDSLFGGSSEDEDNSDNETY